MMLNEYNHGGIRFEYPDDWSLEESADDVSVSVTVSSSHTSFWCVSKFNGAPPAESVIEAVLDVFREEYDELDVYSAAEDVFGDGTVSRDIEFVCLELTNSAFLRAVQTDEFTLLVLYQGTDHELAETRELLEQMTLSLAVAAEEEV